MAFDPNGVYYYDSLCIVDSVWYDSLGRKTIHYRNTPFGRTLVEGLGPSDGWALYNPIRPFSQLLDFSNNPHFSCPLSAVHQIPSSNVPCRLYYDKQRRTLNITPQTNAFVPCRVEIYDVLGRILLSKPIPSGNTEFYFGEKPC